MGKCKKIGTAAVVVALTLGTLSGCKNNDPYTSKKVDLDFSHWPLQVELSTKEAKDANQVSMENLRNKEWYKVNESGEKSIIKILDPSEFTYTDANSTYKGFIDYPYFILYGEEGKTATDHTIATFVGYKSFVLEDGPLSGTYVFQKDIGE